MCGACLKPMPDINSVAKDNNTKCCNDDTTTTSCFCCLKINITKDELINKITNKNETVH